MASVDAARLAARSDDAMTTPIQRRRVLFAGAIGSVVEYYDFGVYGYAATTLAALFFPSSSPTASLLATLAVFAIAFVARPIGSILFGHVGDHYGRKPALAIAVLLMALVLLCHAFHLCLCGMRRLQCGHWRSLCAIAAASSRRIVAIEFGT